MVLSCVAENRLDWYVKVENLVLSLRLFGGSLSNIPVIVLMVGGARDEFVDGLARWGVEVRVVESLDPRVPTANKLRMLELASVETFDVLLALDCDVIIMGDLAAEIGRTSLRASPAIRNPLPDAAWERMYDLGGLTKPQKRHTMTVSGESTYPYYNSGVLFVPHGVCSPLFDHWNSQRERLLAYEHTDSATRAGTEGEQRPIQRKAYGDQRSLPCALAAAGLEVDDLPLNLNLSTRVAQFASEYDLQWGPPFIFHYHDRIDSAGFLVQSPQRRITCHLDKFNHCRAWALDIPYKKITSLTLAQRIASRDWLRRCRRILSTKSV